jgi:hypothetical protein
MYKPIYIYKSVDDGYVKLYNSDCDFSYIDIYNDIHKYVYDCDNVFINRRKIGLFTLDKNKLEQPFCLRWKHTPNRYIYQPFTNVLKKLLEKVNNYYNKYKLTDAIVNVYDEGDFIAFHKDYHSLEREPCSIVFSFEYDENEQHIMEFYRTRGENWSIKKDKSGKREEFSLKLPNKSVLLMVGMQKKYVHSIKPGKKRISVVFR